MSELPGEQMSTQDLRFKLQRSGLRGPQGGINGSGGVKDLREKLSGPVSLHLTRYMMI